VQSSQAPHLVEHPRSVDEIAGLLNRMLDDRGFAAPGTDPLRDALVQIAARYGEIVTRCLNAAAGLHLEAFSEPLGGPRRPAQAARVHVGFRPAPAAARRSDEARRPARVPIYTRLAARGEDSGEPAIFETLAELELVRAEPVRAVFVDAGHRRFADVGAILSEAGFGGDIANLLGPVAYALHIGHRAAFGLPGLQRVRVRVDLQDAGLPDSGSQFVWVVATANGDLALEVESDTTGNLSHGGEVVLTPPSEWPAVAVDGIESRWLTLRLRRRLEATEQAAHWRPPRLAALSLRMVAATGPQAVPAACHDGMPLDISKDMFPFGERPRFGSAFQVLSPVFGEAGAGVEVMIRLTNPEGSTAPPIPPVSRDGLPNVVWEISTTSGFQAVAANDGTQSLTQDGALVFSVPDDVSAIPIAGKTGAWLRARLVSGHYGTIPAIDGTTMVVQRAPAVRSIAVRSTLERGPLPPEHLVSEGALTKTRIGAPMPSPVDAFPSPDIDGPVLYIGLDTLGAVGEGLDTLKALGDIAKGRVISWHIRPPSPPARPIVVGKPTPNSGACRWQMRSADGWRDTTIHDASAGLTRPGIVQLTLSDEPEEWPGNVLDPAGRKLAWLRVVRPVVEGPRTIPRLPIGLTINSVLAQHSQHLSDEIVGSSNGRKDQIFKALRTPIIGDVVLQVRELDDDWVTWNEVDTLALSRPESRDFTLERSTGELRFGDGRRGRIPPPGANNVRLHRYATGGGRLGNQPAKAIAQLLSAVPAVEAVVNLEPAAGGLDAEDAAQVRSHAAAWLRHRDRAVCADDFADLARKASPAVARAICVAGRDLGVSALVERGELEPEPGVVSAIVIPWSADPAPQPSLDLLETVKNYLDARRSPVGRLVTVGPTYARVSVRLQVVPTAGSPPDELASECERRIAEFLHPLTGGPEGTGWATGRQPHRSDIYGLVDGIDGVDFVRGLSVVVDVRTGMPVIVAAGTIAVEPVSEP
jgi:hypothetical protein